jgi:hypothetical protein
LCDRARPDACARRHLLAQLLSTFEIALGLNLANADLLPFAFTNLGETVQGYVKDLQSLRDKRSEQIVERNKQIEEGLFSGAVIGSRGSLVNLVELLQLCLALSTSSRPK